MKSSLFPIIIFLLFISTISCDKNTKQEKKSTHTIHNLSENQNKSLEEKLKSVKDNFNTIKNWTKIDSIELEETSESGVAEYYHHDGKSTKVITRNYGETFQQITEYYLSHDNLSFVFDKTLYYNRPMYYDEELMKENGDTES